jgi:hypothetical protein
MASSVQQQVMEFSTEASSVKGKVKVNALRLNCNVTFASKVFLTMDMTCTFPSSDLPQVKYLSGFCLVNA